MLKKYLLLSFLVAVFFGLRVYADLSPDQIIPEATTNFGTITGESGFGALDALLGYVRDSFFRLLALIVITVFILVGARLIMARGNPEEFSKALWMFLYACIGLFIIALSYVAVRLVAGLKL